MAKWLDFHAHFNLNDPELVKKYVANAEKNEAIVAFSGGLHYGGHDFLPNEEVIKLCNEYPDILIPLVKIDLWDTPPDPSEARKYADMGAKGFKFIYPYYEYDHESYMPLYEEIEKLGLPVLFHTGNYRPSEADIKFKRPILKNMHPINLDTIARSFQKLHIVMAHMGTSLFRELAAEMVKMLPNLYFDLAGCGAFYGVTYRDLARMLEYENGRDVTCNNFRKLVFGSDSYINYTNTQDNAIEAYTQIIKRNNLPEDIAKGIQGGTVASWLGIKF